jgi:p-cumate 2,3-dioxygenase alpha subunit
MDVNGLVLDDPQAGVFRVHRSTMTSDAVLALEQERIFDRCWLYLGHETELPAPGDFVRRTIAGRPLIFIRGADGTIRAFYNTCTHRGALICRQDQGHADVFQCFYHAWSFNTRGELVGLPDEAGYGSGFDRAERALQPPPRLEQYRGFYFVSFDPEIVDLVTYLAGAKEYLDLILDQSETGMRVLPGANKYAIRANWKLLSENSGDIYHAPPLHRTYFEYIAGVSEGMKMERLSPGRARSLGNGHASTESAAVMGRPIARWHPLFGAGAKEEIARIRARLVERHGEERASRMADTTRLMVIYPNLAIHDTMAITVRQWWPTGPDTMEVTAWELAPQEEDGDRLARRLDSFLTFFGPGGFSTPDDVEALESCQVGFGAREVEWSDVSRGMHRDAQDVDELQTRAFWRQWYAQMQGESPFSRRNGATVSDVSDRALAAQHGD